jgi:hypothetical protein
MEHQKNLSKEEHPMNKYVALSLHQYVEGFLDDATLKERRLSELSSNIDILTKQLATIDQCIHGKDPCPFVLLKDSEFMDAEQKRKVLSQWARFINGGFSFHLFTDSLYEHLIHHCGFIAHYNRSGFYSTYWSDDLVALARQTGMILRPVPGTFVDWERFLRSFQCWHEWLDMGINMLHLLKSHLISVLKELENEVVGIFKHDLGRLYPLHLEERRRVALEADELRQKLVNLTTKLDDMDPDSFLDDMTKRYRELFPSMAPQNFVEADLVDSLV